MEIYLLCDKVARGKMVVKRDADVDFDRFGHHAGTDSDRHSIRDREVAGRLSGERWTGRVAGQTAGRGAVGTPHFEKSSRRRIGDPRNCYVGFAGARHPVDCPRIEPGRFSRTARAAMQTDPTAESDRQHQLDSPEVPSTPAHPSRPLLGIPVPPVAITPNTVQALRYR